MKTSELITVQSCTELYKPVATSRAAVCMNMPNQYIQKMAKMAWLSKYVQKWWVGEDIS